MSDHNPMDKQTQPGSAPEGAVHTGHDHYQDNSSLNQAEGCNTCNTGTTDYSSSGQDSAPGCPENINASGTHQHDQLHDQGSVEGGAHHHDSISHSTYSGMNHNGSSAGAEHHGGEHSLDNPHHHQNGGTTEAGDEGMGHDVHEDQVCHDTHDAQVCHDTHDAQACHDDHDSQACHDASGDSCHSTALTVMTEGNDAGHSEAAAQDHGAQVCPAPADSAGTADAVAHGCSDGHAAPDSQAASAAHSESAAQAAPAAAGSGNRASDLSTEEAHSKVEQTLQVAEAAAAAAVAAADAAHLAAADAVAAAKALNFAHGYEGVLMQSHEFQDFSSATEPLSHGTGGLGNAPYSSVRIIDSAGTAEPVQPVVMGTPPYMLMPGSSIAASASLRHHNNDLKSDVATSGLHYDDDTISFNTASEKPEIENDGSHEVIHGTPASRGIAVGRICFMQRNAPLASKRGIEDADAEVARFEKARAEAIAQLGSLYEVTVERLGEQNAVVFQIHQMMLDDPDYVDAIEQTIRDEMANAEYAVEVTGHKFAELFSQMDNDYMQGRAADVIDVSRRLSDILNENSGFKQPHHLVNANEPVILATDDLAPSETVQLDQNLVKGIITSEGSSRSHTVIFARTLGLPAVISIGNRLTPDLEGKLAIIDGGAGRVIIDPDEKTLGVYADRKRTEDALRARLEQFRGRETRTLSGRKISLYANIGAVSDLDLVKSSDAEGIGLFRSEYIYLSSSDYPSEETQFNIYRETLSAMEGKRVIIRTLDIGADKTADYFMLKHEENPAMGMRAIRICLTQPEVFKTQLRALYRASVYGRLAILFPMISSVEEVKDCRRICEEVKEELRREGREYSDNIELGIMIETPASAVISDLLAEHVDFFSIGTNDLTQFTLAVDRQNAELGRFLNPYHRAVIRLIEMTVNNAHKHGIWVGVCGELAADEGFTHELVRMGIDEISVVPSSVLMIRARISTLG